MAKVNLEMGFLFLYEWLPLFETLSDADAGRLMMALIRRQKDGIVPQGFENPLLDAYARVIDATIVRRLAAVRSSEEKQNKGGQRADPQNDDIRTQRAPPLSEAKRSVAEKSVNKRNKYISPSSGEGGDKEDEDISVTEGYFNEFWSVYPRKVGKGAAKKTFIRLKPDRELTDTMISAIDHQRRSEQWTRDGGRFIPHPATWLSREQWNDELVMPDYGIYYPPREDDLSDLFDGLTVKKGENYV